MKILLPLSTDTTRKLISGLFALALFAFGTQAAAKYGGGSDEDSPLAPVLRLVEESEYDRAIEELERLLIKDRKNTDVLSLLGYSYRKQQRYGLAIQYYNRALAIDPKHKATNEYLGQLLLEIGKPDKAKERLKVLDEACFFTCAEYTSLKEAIDQYLQ